MLSLGIYLKLKVCA